jgi:dethiobiotin synthetase
MNAMRLVVSGIGTDVGKTVVSAILAEALQAHYWKPVQAGDLDNTDSMKVQRLAPSAKILPEQYKLRNPKSPHAAAADDGLSILPEALVLPDVEPLLVEGAGGLMVPINDQAQTYLDLIVSWSLPVVLVSRHYLGSINHTLLSLEALRQRGVELYCVIFVGDNPESERIIRTGGKVIHCHSIPEVGQVNPEFIRAQAERIIEFFKGIADER